MKLHEELGLVTSDPEVDICDEQAPIWDMTKHVLMRSVNKN
jgi:hypothetical protein